MPGDKIVQILSKDFALMIKKDIEDRRQWRMYRTVNVIDARAYESYLSTEPSQEFATFVINQVNDYVLKGAEMPEAIACPIRNIADDAINGRKIVMRSGDYIALQTYFKAHGAK